MVSSAERPWLGDLVLVCLNVTVKLCHVNSAASASRMGSDFTMVSFQAGVGQNTKMFT